MTRRRVRVGRSGATVAGQVLVGLLALGVAYYGAMLALLALKVSPGTVETLSGYRAAYDALAGLREDDVTGTARLIAGLVGLAVALLCGWLALAQLPRPRLTRTELELRADDHGVVTLRPRAIERLAETAAAGEDGVREASARWERGSLTVALTVGRARGLPDVLHGARGAVAAAVERHGLPPAAVHVICAKLDPITTRELD